MQNVAPTRSLARRSRQLLIAAFVVAALGTFIAIIGLAMFVLPLVNEASTSYGFYAFIRGVVFGIGALVFLGGVLMAVRAVTWRTDNDLAMQTARQMLQYPQVFDGRYTFIRNVSKMEIGYIDAVLVGPPGVLVYRIVDSSGHFANEAANWLKEARRNEWMPAGIEPTRECVADIKKLREYLAKHKLPDVPVFGLVVFTKEPPVTTLTAKEPTVPICQFSTMLPALEAEYLKRRERIDANLSAAVTRLLYNPNG